MNLSSCISLRQFGAYNRVVRCLRAILPLICLLCFFASPASAQTFTLNVNSVNQLSYEVKVQLSITGTCTQEGTWTINWGDTNTTTPSAADRTSEQSHTYTATGSYTITYSVDCTQFGDAQSITATATIDATTASPTEVVVGASSGIANWTAFTGATAYILDLQVGTTGSISTLRPGTHVTSVNFTVAPNATNCCKNGTAYRARIKVAGSARESEWSDWDDFVFSGTTSFTGTPFSVSISLAYNWSDRTLQITTGTNGGTGEIGINECQINALIFLCPMGTFSRSASAGRSHTVSVSNTRGTERHSASATIDVPSSPPPAPESDDDGDDGDSGGSGDSGDSGGSSGNGGPLGATPAPAATLDPARMPVPTLDVSQLPEGAEILHSGRPWTSFREVTGSGIGSRSLLDRGARQAIDVAGPLGVEAEVCFAGIGSLVLLDAAYSPRREMAIDSHRRGDMTCGYLDRPGTLVLMPGEPTHAIVQLSPTATLSPAGAGASPLVPDDPASAWALSDCQISSEEILHVRERPAGRIMGYYLGQVMTVTARTTNWFRLNFYGRTGWVSASFVTAEGLCS